MCFYTCLNLRLNRFLICLFHLIFWNTLDKLDYLSFFNLLFFLVVGEKLLDCIAEVP